MKNTFQEIISTFRNINVFVVGDIMIDEYVWGKVSRISPEAPVPVVDITSRTYLPGGAANVMNNIHTLGGNVTLCGVIGADMQADWFLDILRQKKLPTTAIFQDDNRPTTVKTRIVAQNQQIARMDHESRRQISPELVERIISYFADNVSKFDSVLLSDYCKGVINTHLIQGLLDICKKHNVPILVDPKVTHFNYYRNVTCITPNTKEAQEASGIEITDDASLHLAAGKIMESIHCEALLITRGEHGMSLFREGFPTVNIPTVAQKVYDVTGAGDTVISVMSLALGAHVPFEKAAYLANYAAGIVVGEFGTATVSGEKLIEELESYEI